MADSLIKTVDAAFARTAKKMPGFRARESQREMAVSIVDALTQIKGERIIAVEGQTGTGKTLGYLLSSIPVAQKSEAKLVIATATIALQSQLVERDLPAMQQYSGLEFDFIVAKGRGRYLCPSVISRLTNSHPNQDELFAFDTEDIQVDSKEKAKEHETLLTWKKQFDNNVWDGCKDSLDEEPAPELWSKVTSSAATCAGKNCSQQRRCPFYRARWAMRDADVIVANHDLVLSDLALGGGVVLPPPKDTIYVFDEGHHLPEKAVEHGSAKGNLAGLSDLLKQIPKVLKKVPNHQSPDLSEAMPPAHDLVRDLRALLGQLNYAQTWAGDEIHRAPGGRLPQPLIDLAEQGRLTMLGLWRPFDLLVAQLQDLAKTDTAIGEVVLPEVGNVAERLSRYEQLFSLWTKIPEPKEPPVARWIERTKNDFHMQATPVTAAPWLKNNLWSRCAGVVVTSATLTSLNQWNRFRAKTGLRDDNGTKYLRLPSPFDYANNSQLYIPWMQHDGGQAQAHTKEICAMMGQLLTYCDTGTLCLFTSWRQLREVHDSLPAELKKRVLRQGSDNRELILSKHRKRIEQGKPSILFGVASMSEGLDLPGKLCEHVIIAKLPFAPPDSPVDATRAEWLKEQGMNPFLIMSVPDTSLKLIQTCGRLIRSESDIGRITILDRRVVTKQYGKSLLEALPPFPQIIESAPKQAANG